MNRRVIAAVILAATITSVIPDVYVSAEEVLGQKVESNEVGIVEGEIPLDEIINNGEKEEVIKPEEEEEQKQETKKEEIKTEEKKEEIKSEAKKEEVKTPEKKEEVKPSKVDEKAEKIKREKSKRPVIKKRAGKEEGNHNWETAILKDGNIQLHINPRGNVALYDKKGNNLLYGATNQEALRINGKVYYMFDTYNEIDGYEKNEVIGNKLVSTITIDGIKVTRTLSLGKGVGSSIVDTLKFSYEFENTSKEEKTLDFKLILDTMVGSNDWAPFSTPNLGEFNTGKNTSGSGIPSYWFAYEDLTNVDLVARANLGVDMPDHVTFGNWVNMIEYDLQSDWAMLADEQAENEDSAVAMTWNGMKLKAGEKVTVKTDYGVSDMQTGGEDLVIGILGDEEPTLEEITNAQYETSISLLNNTDKVIKDVSIKAEVPKEFQDIIEIEKIGRADEFFIGDIEVNGRVTQPIKLKIKPIKEDKKVTYDIIAKAGDKEISRVTHTLNIKNVEHKIEATLKTPKEVELNLDKDGKYENVDLEALVKNISTDERATIKNMKINIQVPDKYKDLVALTEDSLGEIKVDELEISKEMTHKWTLGFNKPNETTEIPVRIVYTGENLDKEKILETKVKLVVEKPVTPPEPTKPTKPVVKPTKPVVKPTKPVVKPTKPSTGDASAVGLVMTGLIGIMGLIGLKKKK